MAAELAECGVTFRTPYLHKSREPDPARAARLAAVRYRLETVNGQLADRYHGKRTWARDLSHLTNRVTRKVLSHTAMVWVARRQGHPPLPTALVRPTPDGRLNLHTALAMLSREKFDKTMAFLHREKAKQVRTNNHVDRTNRQLRCFEKVRYKWRRRRTIVRFIVLALDRWRNRRVVKEQITANHDRKSQEQLPRKLTI